MIEKKYTGVAKQGADVVANPTLDGSEENLESIGINGTNYKVSGKPFIKYFAEEITTTFILGECDNLTYVFEWTVDSTFPISFYNKTKDKLYQLRVGMNGSEYSFGEVELTENHSAYISSYEFGGFDDFNYISFEDYSLFGENDEIEVRFYYSEVSPKASL